ncbi:ABC transporter permease subunit [Lacisediminihabitans profunda]|uniref:ATP-binding cassette domain-containing protein n=1 Tax=Lacisediminihabitans profunda TaxID=2594790 RepID=A0A5C8UNL6_9MICO|nr:ATP-binding cassette domain-containing protein [Lacisediminihabitans profunda]TXN29966.1 ATP-binding cassette domain-containing protein [Lacisediminihabitans profunda]
MSTFLARQSPRSRRVTIGMVVLLVAYLASTFGVANGSYGTQSLVLVAAIFAILALSLDLVAGVTGLYSLGHAGLFALGAYSTTLLNSKFGWNLFLLLPLSIAGVGIVGLVLGFLSLRVSGLYFAITTFIFTLVVVVLLSDFSFTGGLQGIAGPVFPDFPPGLAFLGSSVAWCVGLSLLVTIVIIWSIRSSPLYPVLLAIRDAEPFAAAAGVRTSVMKVGIFGLSASLAGLAGWAFSFLGFISPGQFSWTVSVNILVMVILGGINTRLGPIIGAAFVSAFPVVVSIDPFLQEVIFGLIFVVVIVFFPQGFMGLVGSLARRIRARFRPTAVVVEAVEDDASTPIAYAHLAPQEAVSTTRALPAVDEVALAAKNIVFGYNRGVLALNNVDMVVKRGNIHGLIGPNGSGKSTLVNLMSGRMSPNSGTITADGVRIERLRAPARARRGVMRTFQSAVLVRELTAQENVGIGLYSRFPGIAARSPIWPLLMGARRDSRAIAQKSIAALTSVGLSSGWATTRVADVPHGVEQLTQLAAACIAEPSILILDEPLAGLSSGEVEQVSEILRGLKRAGVTVIVVEHQTRFIFEMCDEVTVLAAGELVTTGTAADVRANERVREVYLGQ